MERNKYGNMKKAKNTSRQCKQSVNIKSQKGITLVTLVITIVIIIILSAIAINFTFGENGLITRAEQSKELAEVSAIQEQMEMIKADEYIEGQGTIDPDRYFDKLEDAGVIVDKDTDVVDNGDGTYEVTADPDYVFEVTLKPDKENPTDLEIDYVGKGENDRPEEPVKPEINEIKIVSQTDSSISIEIDVKNAEGATYTYSYRKEGDPSWIDATTNNSNTYVYEGLEASTTYEIKVKVETAEGTAEEETKVTLGAPEVAPEGTITFGETTWSGYKASITVNTSAEGYTIEYQVNGTDEESWQTVGNGGTIQNLNQGDTVYARITDGSKTSGTQEKEIADTTNPTVVVNANGTTSSSVSVTVQAVDNESGMKDDSTYTYSIKETSQGDETYNTPGDANGITNTSYTFTGLTQGTNYTVRVQVNGDKANNVGTGTLANQTTESIPSGGGDSGQEQGAITFGSVTWSAGQASIVISTTEEEYTIEYQINDTQEEQWETLPENGQVTGLSHGDAVYARLTDGTNHGDYASTNIQDEVAPTVTVSPGGTTTNSVSVTASATDAQTGMKDSLTYTYSIKVTGRADSTYNTPSNANSIATNSYTFTGLTQGTNYTVRVQVNGDKANNVGTGTLANQITGTVGGATGGLQTGNIVATNPIWSNGTASITLTTSTGLQIQYQKNAITGSWTTISSGGQVTGLNHGDTVFARLTDGINYGDYASVAIKDETPPTINSMTTSNITANSVTVIATASDGQSGLATSGTYKYYLNSESSPRGTNTTGSYTFTGLNESTSYTIKVVVTDKAGNETEDTRTVKTITAPSIEETLEEGDYVYYEDAKGTTQKCAVLYDDSSSYGIEIVTMTSVEDVELGSSSMTSAVNAWNKVISDLNDKADEYNNTDYSTRARCIGSNPSNPNSETTSMHVLQFGGTYSGRLKSTDSNYRTDVDQMDSIGSFMDNIYVAYWLASRYVDDATNACSFDVRWSRNGSVDSYSGWIINITNSGQTARSESATAGFRPVFKLKSGIKVTGGNGTSEDPYTLGT